MKVDWVSHDAWIMTADGWDQLCTPEDEYAAFLTRDGPVIDGPKYVPLTGMYFEGYDDDEIAAVLQERFKVTADQARKWMRLNS